MRPRVCALLVLLLALPARLPAAELQHFDDASLNAIQFVDGREGWAVGDEGVIWHTIDGGQIWERQSTGVNASLRSIAFLNLTFGWVVGREELPGGGSTGVLLCTEDGCKWQRVLANTLPGLNVVRFANEKVGYLAGDGSDHHPTGTYSTDDSGADWKAVPGPRCSSWYGAAVTEQGTAVLAGAWNRMATAQPNRVLVKDSDVLGGRSLRGVHFVGNRGVAVGQGGLILVCDRSSGKEEWHPFQMPPEYQANLDLYAVHGVGSHFWAVGRPGSVVLHSKDSGDHWELLPTRQSVPLNSVFFINEHQGWACGELGTILVTADGGKSWRVQKRGGERVAALLLHARSAGVPLETITHLGAQDGYLTAAVRVTAPDSATSSPARTTEGMRFHSAVRQAGGVCGEMLWQFPLSSHVARGSEKDLLKSWSQFLGEDNPQDQLLRQLVLALRIWRPSLVITDCPSEQVTGSTADGLLVEAMRVALEQAGDPKAFPEQVNNLGLSPWRPTKAYALGTDAKTASVSLDLTAVSPVLASSVQEFVGPAFSLLEAYSTPPAQRFFRFLLGADGTAEHKYLMQGIDLAHGGLARRPLQPVAELTPEQQKAIRQRANLRAFSETPSGLAKPEALLAQLGPMVADMDLDQAGRAIHGVALQYARMGQWALARETFLLLLDRFPAHPLAPDAYRWLLKHNSSSEARRRHEMGQFLVIGQQSLAPVVGNALRGVPGPAERHGGRSLQGEQGPATFQPPQFETRQAQQLAILTNKAETRQWYQSCERLEKDLAAFGPLFTRDPAIEFCVLSARRNLGDFDTPRKRYGQLAAALPEGPWKRAAQAELWLLNRTGPPPGPVLQCPAVLTRPHLDGKLDDSCWQAPQPIKLTDAGGKTAEQYPTEVRLACDRENLYVGVRCFHPPNQSKPQRKPRLHDVDLRDQDRVSLVFDLDRDYSTCFHLQVDQRGCLLEDCWGDRTWDPRWYVGMQTESCCWAVELAIPLSALTGDAVTPGKAWAFNAIRVVPGEGVQAWSLPAEAPEENLRTEGLGLLLFTQGQQPNAAAEGPRMMPRVQ